MKRYKLSVNIVEKLTAGAYPGKTVIFHKRWRYRNYCRDELIKNYDRGLKQTPKPTPRE